MNSFLMGKRIKMKPASHKNIEKAAVRLKQN